MPRRLTALSMRSVGKRVCFPQVVHPLFLGSGRQSFMLTCDHRHDNNPNESESNIYRCVSPHRQSYLSTCKNEDCGKYVSRSPKKGINRSLGLVLGLAACRKEERLTSRILNRIVCPVFHHFRNSDQPEQRHQRHHSIAGESYEWHDKEGSTNTNVLKDS